MKSPSILAPLRHRFLRAVREWFEDAGFIELETPIAVTSPGMEPHLRAFETSAAEVAERHRRLYLHTSPEYHMKRALARHPVPIYQIARCFRDEPASRLHAHEFAMLEWYRPDADYRALMDDVDGLLSRIAETLLGGAPLALPDGRVALTRGCERQTVRDAFLEYAGVDPFAQSDAESFRDACLAQGLAVEAHWSWEDMFHFVLLERVEAHLGLDRPTILYGYPPSLAALSRVVGGVAERFELYLAGHELGNAFSELVDATEQRRRFEAERAERLALGRPVYPIDEDLLDALERLAPCAGIAVGLDRAWLLVAEHALGARLDLKDVLFAFL